MKKSISFHTINISYFFLIFCIINIKNSQQISNIDKNIVKNIDKIKILIQYSLMILNLLFLLYLI